MVNIAKGTGRPAGEPVVGANLVDWAHLTGADFQSLDRDRCVVVVSCSPMEVHGPHLPVVTDTHESEGLTERIAARLAGRYPDKIFLRLPPIYVAADVLPHPGSIRFRSSTIERVISDLGRSLCKQGFRDIWVGNFHGGPRHFVSIETACRRVNRRYGGRMISVFGLLLDRLTSGGTDPTEILGHIEGIEPEDLNGDTHAGLLETSMMLHLLSEHVDPSYRRLPRRTVDIRLEELGKKPEGINGRPTLLQLVFGFRHKLKYFEAETYAGKPAIATPELGEAFLDTLSGYAADALCEVLDGRLDPKDCVSPLYKVRWIFTSETFAWLFERVMRHRNPVF